MALVLLVAFMSMGCSLKQPRSVHAADGAADLSRGYDFDGGDLVRLDGDWEFYRGRLLGPGEFPPGPAPAFIPVPKIWAAANGFEHPKDPPTGVASLRLTVKVPPVGRDWALRVPNAYCAVRVFVNGRQVAEVGSVSADPERYMPSNGLALPQFHAEGGTLEIVMQVANFSTPSIGTWDSPILGAAPAILLKRQRDVVSTSLISGALLIMGLYHFGLFLLRKKDRTSLLFGLICVLMAIRSMMMGERLLLDLFPAGAAAWEWAFRIEHLSAHLVLPLFALFFLYLYPRELHPSAVLVIAIGGGLWAALTLLTPAMTSLRFLHWYEFFILAASLYIFGAIAVAAIRREEGALLVLGGLMILVATSANDVFLSVGLLSQTFYMASYGVFVYIFVQSFHLSMIFSKSFRNVEELSATLMQTNSELESLHAIDLAITSSLELDKVLDVILRQAVDRLGMDAADVLLLNPGEGSLSFGARIGFHTDALVHTRLMPGEGFAGSALQSAEPIIVRNLDEDVRGFRRSPSFAAEGFCFYSGLRLTVKGKLEGVIELYRRSPFQPSDSWVRFFETLAVQASVALDNASLLRGLWRANEELVEANEATIEGWAEALELRDQETEGHCRRVTAMTMDLARRFGIAGSELDAVRHGALLHDIGKMGIPDSILLKPGPLSDEEFAIMKRHPAIAHDLLSKLRFLEKSLDIPYCHHEKWDGSGYPRRLEGAAIPLSARLFAVVDVWDALRSDRPYRKGWPEEKVLSHIVSLSGSHFDPDAVDAFIELRRAQGSLS
jgi:putative nucleotidyltransferase with HDIG domain